MSSSHSLSWLGFLAIFLTTVIDYRSLRGGFVDCGQRRDVERSGFWADVPGPMSG